MAQSKREIVPMGGLRDQPVMHRPFSGEPACAPEAHDPTWWDLETHRHGGTWACTPCQMALKICNECPVKARCAQIGAEIANPWFIYGGKSWTRHGPVPGCCRCQTPLYGAGVRRSSGMCSVSCERGFSDLDPDMTDAR